MKFAVVFAAVLAVAEEHDRRTRRLKVVIVQCLQGTVCFRV